MIDRRELLTWISPLVVVVALPAHAQTSETCDDDNCMGVGTPLEVEQP